MEQKAHRRAVFGWTMYDWANSAFSTTISAAVLPVYYSTVASAGLDPAIATSNWAFTTTIALVLIAVFGPILGAMADFSGAKKRFMSIFVMIGALATGLLFLVGEGDWMLASVIFIFASLGFSGANVFYDSFLPHVAGPDEIDQVSSRGFAMGYAGGGILLAVNLAMIMLTEGETRALMTRLSFVTVAVWWIVFTVPFWRWVREPQRRRMLGEENFNPVSAALHRLSSTFKEISKYRQLVRFLVAFWLYNNGIGTIIVMATIYGTELGFSQTTTIGTLLMVQFVAVPFALLFGWLAKRIGIKPSILLSLGMYTAIAIAGYFLSREIHFWVLGFMVATVQGGSQALSRSLFGRMLPPSKSAEFFSFFSVSEKIAGTAGPLVFGIVSRLMGGSRLAIVSLIIFFAAGALLLSQVSVAEGVQVAQEEELALNGRTLA